MARLGDAVQDAGLHKAEWDGCNRVGMMVENGTYFYRLTAGKSVITKKTALIR